MPPAQLLLLEDDPQLRDVLVRSLRAEGFDIRAVGTANELLERVSAGLPDAFVIDIGLPDADGRDVCQALRARGIDTPVLFLTARDALADRLSGFGAGGDDYVCKPFDMAEVAARLEALTRRLPLRRRLLLSVVGAVAVALVVLIGAFNLVLRDRLDHEADTSVSARAAAELGSLRVVSRRLVVPETPDAAAPDTQAWVFSAGRVLEQPRSDPATQRAARRLSLGGRGTVDPPGTHTRLLAVPVEASGRRLGTVVAAVSLRPYESIAQIA